MFTVRKVFKYLNKLFANDLRFLEIANASADLILLSLTTEHVCVTFVRADTNCSIREIDPFDRI